MGSETWFSWEGQKGGWLMDVRFSNRTVVMDDTIRFGSLHKSVLSDEIR